MPLDWKFDIINATNASVGMAWKMPSASDDKLPADTFRWSFRSIERSANAVIDSKMIAELTIYANYTGLFDALSELHSLNEDDPAVIDTDTFSNASTVLSLLASRAAEPPKIFSHGGDAAVFSWTDFEGVKYITVSGGCAVFARKDRGSKSVTIGVADMSESNGAELMPYVGVIRDGSSTNSVR